MSADLTEHERASLFDQEGYLKKLPVGKSSSSWQTRYFILIGSVLLYFPSKPNSKRINHPRGIIPLGDAKIVDEEGLQFTIQHRLFLPVCFHLKANCEDQKSQWMEALGLSSQLTHHAHNQMSNELKRHSTLLAILDDVPEENNHMDLSHVSNMSGFNIQDNSDGFESPVKLSLETQLLNAQAELRSLQSYQFDISAVTRGLDNLLKKLPRSVSKDKSLDKNLILRPNNGMVKKNINFEEIIQSDKDINDSDNEESDSENYGSDYEDDVGEGVQKVSMVLNDIELSINELLRQYNSSLKENIELREIITKKKKDEYECECEKKRESVIIEQMKVQIRKQNEENNRLTLENLEIQKLFTEFEKKENTLKIENTNVNLENASLHKTINSTQSQVETLKIDNNVLANRVKEVEDVSKILKETHEVLHIDRKNLQKKNECLQDQVAQLEERLANVKLQKHLES
eukprot:TRINITY_DN34983_c0_g1_i1.p1 TRINITY_DN34983_c0_g1~~TRINITY_DN34983_c0_g1_i1.p1  ORF type:complete len:459 (-),score=118.37 TRINITY_DN34983_c0_g1_i1:201-1577(-)